MKALTLKCLVVLSLSLTTSSLLAQDLKITVYSLLSLPVYVPTEWTDHTRVTHLDRIRVIETSLAEELYAMTPDRRADAARERVDKDTLVELRAIWKDIMKTRHLGLSHLPAIVINNEAVYYGADLQRAVSLYRSQRG